MIVEANTVRFDSIALDSGATLAPVDVAYETYGRLNASKSNAILGSDVVQDVRPSRVEGVNQPIHQIGIQAMGLPLIDNCILEDLGEAAAKRRRWAFLLTINPLRVPGATGGPVNPIATF